MSAIPPPSSPPPPIPAVARTERKSLLAGVLIFSVAVLMIGGVIMYATTHTDNFVARDHGRIPGVLFDIALICLGIHWVQWARKSFKDGAIAQGIGLIIFTCLLALVILVIFLTVVVA